jgi:transposase
LLFLATLSKRLNVYLRHTKVRKNNKTLTYWRLVRSVRKDGKVVQETVAQLGELDAQGRARAQALVREFTGQIEQPDLFTKSAAPDAVVAVRLRDVRVERGRRFGDVWLAWMLWRALRLDEVCERLLPQGREHVAWSTMAAVSVIARLCAPSSELNIAEDWYRTSALEDLLGLTDEQVNEDRLYRTLDKMLPYKVAIEQHLKTRLGELFKIDYDLLLYDVTSTYFEGQADGNHLARRGYSRDHRPDCKQVCIALVVTREGMPLGYEIFAGNRTDVTTVEEIVGTMESRYGLAQRVWVMDRGMVSAENIAWLNETHRRYLIGTAKSEVKKWGKVIAEADNWKMIRDGVEVKLCSGPDGKETFVVCRSAERREKEKAIHERFAVRIEAGLSSLARRLERMRTPADRGGTERQLGRLLGRNSRAAGRYEAKVEIDTTRASGLRLDWYVRPEWDEWAAMSEGCYVLRTNITDWTPETLWQTYVQLTDAEDAFRTHKSQLSLRPIWHHRADRTQAHILVCFLAYVMWKTLEQWQVRAGLGNSPRTILDELARIQSTDVVLPLADGDCQRELRIRCVVRPDKAQAALLDRLGLRLPARLRPPRQIAKM